MKRSTHTIAAGLAGLSLLVAACGDDGGTSVPAAAMTTESPVSGTGLPTNGLPASAQGAEHWVDADAGSTAFSSSADASERWSSSQTEGCETQPTPDAIENCVSGS